MSSDHVFLQVILPIKTLETTTISTLIGIRKEMNSPDMSFQLGRAVKLLLVLAPFPCAPKIAAGLFGAISSLAWNVKVHMQNLG